MMLQMVTDLMGCEEKAFHEVGSHTTGRSQEMIVLQLPKMLGYAADILKHEEGRKIWYYPVDQIIIPTTGQAQDGDEQDVEYDHWQFAFQAFVLGFVLLLDPPKDPERIAQSFDQEEVGEESKDKFPLSLGEGEILASELSKPVWIVFGIEVLVVAKVVDTIALDTAEDGVHTEVIGEQIVPLFVFEKAKVRRVMHQDGQRMHSSANDDHRCDIGQDRKVLLTEDGRSNDDQPIERNIGGMTDGTGLIQRLKGLFVERDLEGAGIEVRHDICD